MARPRRATQLTDTDTPLDDGVIVDLARVQVARGSLPDTTHTLRLADLFATLGDPTRLRVVAALQAQELCVGDLAATVRLSLSATSHQLRVLRNQGLVRSRKVGRLVYYTLDDDHVRSLYQEGLDHVEHLEDGG
jgi:DNA-binding transcriptional ArsR family regulator